MRHLFCFIIMLGVVFVSGGAACVPQRTQPLFPPPPVLSDLNTLESVLAAVNRTDSVRQLSTNSASIRDLNQKTPNLGATVHLQRDKNFRLRAKLPMIMGASLDVGSNDDVFWFDVPDGGMTRTMYFARHDRYVNNLENAVIPVNPAWLIEALGLVHLDESLVLQGPVTRNDGLLEIRSWMPDRIHQRVCYIDAEGGFVKQQLLTKPNLNGGETILAESRTSDHRYDSVAQCVLPHRIQIRLLPVAGPEMNLQIEVKQYSVNQLLSGESDLFVMPQTAGNIQDLTRLSAVPAPNQTPSAYIAGPSLQTQMRGQHY